MNTQVDSSKYNQSKGRRRVENIVGGIVKALTAIAGVLLVLAVAISLTSDTGAFYHVPEVSDPVEGENDSFAEPTVDICYVAQIATFDDRQEAIEAASALTTRVGKDVRTDESRHLPGWSPGRTIVFVPFRSQEDAVIFLRELADDDAGIEAIKEPEAVSTLCRGV